MGEQSLRTENRESRTRGVARWLLVLVLGSWFSVLLSGCLLISGARTSEDVAPGGGNLSNSFVSAEGSESRKLQVGGGARDVQVIGIVSVETGDLYLDLLKPDGSVVFTVGSKPGEQITRSGSVPLDDQGRLNYQVHAVGARNGSYQILFQAP